MFTLRDHRAHFIVPSACPNVTDSSKISAKSKHGVLEITVPKTKESLTQKIQIKEE